MELRALHNRVAIVTGAGKGIGRSIALALAGHGARVVLAGRTPGHLEQVKHVISAAGGEACSCPTDMSQEEAIKALVQAALAAYGRIDILVNNAGIGIFKPAEETTAEEWDTMMDINVRGPFLLCREALPYLRRSDGPFIINISSAAGHKAYINQAAYGASKHALIGFSKALAKEVQKDGIRVHVISPGGVNTGLIGDARPDIDSADLMQPQEVADVVLFLVTQAGNAVIDEIRMRRMASAPWG